MFCLLKGREALNPRTFLFVCYCWPDWELLLLWARLFKDTSWNSRRKWVLTQARISFTLQNTEWGFDSPFMLNISLCQLIYSRKFSANIRNVVNKCTRQLVVVAWVSLARRAEEKSGHLQLFQAGVELDWNEKWMVRVMRRRGRGRKWVYSV